MAHSKDRSVLSSVPFGKDHSMKLLSVAAKNLSVLVWGDLQLLFEHSRMQWHHSKSS